jgi:mono/diheme cytochrome c family protein
MKPRAGTFPALAFIAGAILILAIGSVPLISQAAPGGKVVDNYDRNVRLWNYSRLASSGWERGMDLFQMRCWMCHNEYTINEEKDAGGTPAPSLLPLYKRVASNEQLGKQVMAVIRSGGPKMPAFSAATLSDQDVADILAYMRHCGTTPRWCFDGSPSGVEHNPAPNPAYVAK